MTLELFNALLAGAIFFASIGSIANMNGSTCHAVRVAMVFILVGAGGQVLGKSLGQWEHFVDTGFFGGVLALILANQRAPRWISPRLSAPLAIAACLATVSAIAVALSLP